MTVQRSISYVDIDRAVVALLLQIVASVYSSPRDALLADLESGTFDAAVQEVADALGVDAPDVVEAPAPILQSSYVDLFVSSASGLSSPPYVGFAVDGELCKTVADLAGAFCAQNARSAGQ